MDKTLKCVDCGADFVFTTGEQEFYASQGFTSEPRRCPGCRANRKRDKTGAAPEGVKAPQSTVENPRPPRRMFSAVCAECGKETQVPFQPTSGRPVYCSDCYRNNNGGSSRTGSRSAAAARPAAPRSGSSFAGSSFTDDIDMDMSSFADMYPPPSSGGRNRKRNKRDRHDRDRDMDDWQ